MANPFSGNIAAVARAFAMLSERAVRASNAERLRIAKGNIEAGTAQIRLEETTQRRAISRAFALHQGRIAAAATYKGGGAATATERSAATAASEAVSIVTANASAKEEALNAREQVILEDPFLARLKGGLQGQQIASSIAASLASMAEIQEQHSFRTVRSGAGGAPTFPVMEELISTIANIEGFDFGALLNF